MVRTEAEAAKNSDLGVTGDWKNRIFGVGSQVSSLAEGMLASGSAPVDAAVADSKRSADPIKTETANRAFGSLYSGTADRLSQLRSIMVFRVAASVLGQSGRAMSDADVRYAEKAVGDWDSLNAITATLPNIEKIIGANVAATEARTRFKLVPGKGVVFGDGTPMVVPPSIANRPVGGAPGVTTTPGGGKSMPLTKAQADAYVDNATKRGLTREQAMEALVSYLDSIGAQ